MSSAVACISSRHTEHCAHILAVQSDKVASYQLLLWLTTKPAHVFGQNSVARAARCGKGSTVWTVNSHALAPAPIWPFERWSRSPPCLSCCRFPPLWVSCLSQCALFAPPLPYTKHHASVRLCMTKTVCDLM